MTQDKATAEKRDASDRELKADELRIVAGGTGGFMSGGHRSEPNPPPAT